MMTLISLLLYWRVWWRETSARTRLTREGTAPDRCISPDAQRYNKTGAMATPSCPLLSSSPAERKLPPHTLPSPLLSPGSGHNKRARMAPGGA